MVPDDVPTQVGLGAEEENRIVVADEGNPKRHKATPAAASAGQNMLSIPDNFWQQVQDVVASAVVSSMSPIQEAVTSLQAHAQGTDNQIKDLEGRFHQQAGQLQELDHRMAAHFNSVEEQLQQLQKDVLSPKTSPPVSPTGGTGSAGQKSFDVVLGGWQPGEAREWLEEQLASLVDRAGVRQHVAELRPLGNRRPKCVKLILNHPDSADATAKREVQTKVISALTQLSWVPRGVSKPLWIKQDRSILERHIAKAYAITYQFVEPTLMADKTVIEVESWVGLEVWAGKHRILGNAMGSHFGQPPRADEYLVWVVQEQAQGLSVWLDLHGLAQGLSLQPAEVLKKWRSK